MKTSIEEKVGKLAERRTHLRKGLQNFLDEWKEKTDHSDVQVDAKVGEVYFPNLDEKKEVYLTTGKNDLFFPDMYYGETKIELQGAYMSEWAEIEGIKNIIRNLPNAIEKIQKKLDSLITEEKDITFPTWK